ncbi:MAG: ubiquinol-cytochrome c reductase iron-sulfur subunit [Pseudomonadota bacterium]
MSTEGVDSGRRRFLTGSTVVVGAIGAGFTAVPFISSFQPSAKAQAAGAPVTVDIGKLREGERITVEWRGQPVWVIRRPQTILNELDSKADLVADPESNQEQQPEYAKGAYRSIKPEILVLVGLCTHLGCSPSFKQQLGAISPEVTGGFFCPCHGSKFDMAGRVYKSVPAQLNLLVPPHSYLDDNTLMVGADA